MDKVSLLKIKHYQIPKTNFAQFGSPGKPATSTVNVRPKDLLITMYGLEHTGKKICLKPVYN